MKCLAAASLILLHQVAAQSTCPSDLTQISTISSSETLYYEVVDGVFCARMESESEGWLGFGISPTGLMVPSEAVIGLPDEGTVLKYDLTGKSTSAVVPMSDDKQTLMDTSIEQKNGMTTMTFAKIMDEDEYPLVIGDNTVIYAQGSSNTLGYHKSRGSFVLPLEESSASTGTASTAAAGVATDAASESTPAPDAADTPEDGSSGNIVQNMKTLIIGAVALLALFEL